MLTLVKLTEYRLFEEVVRCRLISGIGKGESKEGLPDRIGQRLHKILRPKVKAYISTRGDESLLSESF